MFSSLAIQEEDLRERFNHAKTLNNLADCASALLEFVDYVQAVSPVFASCYEEWRGEPDELQYQKPVFTVGEAAEILAVVRGEGFSRLVTPYYNRKIFSGLNEAKQISFDGSMAVFEIREREKEERRKK